MWTPHHYLVLVALGVATMVSAVPTGMHVDESLSMPATSVVTSKEVHAESLWDAGTCCEGTRDATKLEWKTKHKRDPIPGYEDEENGGYRTHDGTRLFHPFVDPHTNDVYKTIYGPCAEEDCIKIAPDVFDTNGHLTNDQNSDGPCSTSGFSSLCIEGAYCQYHFLSPYKCMAPLKTYGRTIPDGKPCDKDDGCISGNCVTYVKDSASGNLLEAAFFGRNTFSQRSGDLCAPNASSREYNIANDQPCFSEKDETCKSGDCARYSDFSEYVCCGKGVTSWTTAFRYYCLGQKVDEQCNYDEQCPEGASCSPPKETSPGHCFLDAKIANDQPCPSLDKACESGHCGRYSDHSDYVCCGKVTGFLTALNDYCLGRELGDECKHDEQCPEGASCSPETEHGFQWENDPFYLPGKCVHDTNVANDQPCPSAKDETCKSGHCGKYSDHSDYVCCGKGVTGHYCLGQGENKECKYDVQCPKGTSCKVGSMQRYAYGDAAPGGCEK